MQDITESTSSIHSFLNLSRVLHPIVEAAMARKYSIGNYSLTERTIVISDLLRYGASRTSIAASAILECAVRRHRAASMSLHIESPRDPLDGDISPAAC